MPYGTITNGTANIKLLTLNKRLLMRMVRDWLFVWRPGSAAATFECPGPCQIRIRTR